MRPDELERQLSERLEALGPAPRAELLHLLMLPDFERADRIGEFWSYPPDPHLRELLIDPVEDKATKAVVWGCSWRDGAGTRLGLALLPLSRSYTDDVRRKSATERGGLARVAYCLRTATEHSG